MGQRSFGNFFYYEFREVFDGALGLDLVGDLRAHYLIAFHIPDIFVRKLLSLWTQTEKRLNINTNSYEIPY